MTDLIEAYTSWARAGGMSNRTIDERTAVLQRVEAALPFGLERALTGELAGWLGRRGWSDATRSTYFHHINAFYTWACDPTQPVLSANPAAGLRRPPTPKGLPRPVTDAELTAILDRAADPFRLWSILAAYCGLRCCEIAGLRREDVSEHHVLIRRGKGGKAGVVRTHPLVWATVRPLPAGPLARTPTGGQADARWVSIRTAIYFRRQLAMPGVSLHRLRAWTATAMRREGADPYEIMGVLRHSTLNMTLRYVQVAEEERAHAVTALPNLAVA